MESLIQLFLILILSSLAAGEGKPGERAIIGLSLGTLAGAVGAIFLAGNLIMSAIVGGIAGTAAGALTNFRQIHFNK